MNGIIESGFLSLQKGTLGMAKLIHRWFGLAQQSATRSQYPLGSFRWDSGMLRPAIIQSILVFLFIITPLFSHAASLTWQQTGGPQDGYIHSLVIDPSNPSILYAGTFGSGIYKSINGGVSWIPINTGLPPSPPPDLPSSPYSYVISLDPSSPTTLYVGTTENGIFKSTNGGESWSPINNGLTNLGVHMAPAIDPTDPSTLYTGTEGRVFKSTNGGESWSPINHGLGPNEVSTLVIDPSNPSIIYAGLHYDEGYNDGGVFKSTNSGESWSPANNGLPNIDSADSSMSSLVIDPTNSQIVYAGTLGGGIFISTNSGESWSPINNGLTNKIITGIAIDPSNPGVLYIGTWGDGVFRSTNGGVSWSPVNSGLTNYTVGPLVFNPSDPAILYAGTFGSGIFIGSCAHSADYNPVDLKISLSELLRSIQIYNIGEYHCDPAGEDGFGTGAGDQTCAPHNSDYNTQDWKINLSELLRLIQFYNIGEYHCDPEGEDGYASGPAL